MANRLQRKYKRMWMREERLGRTNSDRVKLALRTHTEGDLGLEHRVPPLHDGLLQEWLAETYEMERPTDRVTEIIQFNEEGEVAARYEFVTSINALSVAGQRKDISDGE